MFVFICVKMEAKKPIARCGLASKGKKIQLLTNHYKVNVKNVDGHFFQYTVSFFLVNYLPCIIFPCCCLAAFGRI